MEDNVKNLGVMIFDSLSFEHHIESLYSRLNGTLSYLNRVKNAFDQNSRILLINALLFSHLNYCSSIFGKCSEKQQYEVQKCINFAAKVASNGKYRGRVDDLSFFFYYLSPFCFLSIEFHRTFPISFKTLPYFVCYYSILIR